MQVLMGSKPIQTMCDKVVVIWKRLAVAQEKQKKYANQRHNELQFESRDKVFLRVVSMKRVMRFERNGQLSSRYIGPFEILERVEDVAYILALPPQLCAIHDVFHVSMVRKYISYPMHVLEYVPLLV